MLRRCAVLAILALASTARAQVQFDVKPQFKANEPKYISITSAAPAARFDASLDHEGKPVQIAHGPARAGEHVQLKLPGAGHYDGQVVVTFRDGNRLTQPVKFDVVVAGAAPTIGYNNESYDATAHRLTFTVSRPVGHAELTAIGADGQEIGHAAADYDSAKPGTPLAISFSPTHAGDVMALKLHVIPTAGPGVVATFTPWSISIPHKEVVFETGKWDVRPSEEPKLDACYQRVVDEVGKARKAVPDVQVKLFIAGFTDTVGSNVDNRKLSLERARAIATWFRDRGLPLPIYYAGFGEEVLRVQTPDNTDSEPNRRADYVVSFNEPLIARGVHAQWMKLQ